MRHLHGRRARRHHVRRRRALRAGGGVALLAVVGPGLLAGLSDDDPAGITTYSILGADHGYRLLWVLTASTAALIVFHELGARLGVVTGQGLLALARERFGPRAALALLVPLVVANVGTACAEFAGVAASLKLAHVAPAISVPLAAIGVTALVLGAGFHRVEHVLLALSAVFAAYLLAGVLAHPDWGAAARGLATLHGHPIQDAGDAAAALKPLAGSFASALFGAGLLGAALLAASVVPLSTAYSVAEAAGHPGRLDDGWRQARVFYATYVAVAVVAAAIVLIPGAPLVRILYLTQALNAVLLLPVLWAIRRIAGDRERLGRHALSRAGAAVTGVTFAAIATSVIALGWLSL